MSWPASDVGAIVQAAGLGTRLGLGPKAFVMLGGRTLLEHAVRTMQRVAAHVTVAVPPDDVARASESVGGTAVSVIAGGARRIDTLRTLVGAASAPWLLLHDVVHPLATVELSRRVVGEARRSGAAAATLPNADFLYGADGELLAAPGDVAAIQKPVAFRRTDILRGFAIADRPDRDPPAHEPSVVEILALAGRRVAHVPGGASNFKLTTAADLELARCLLSGRRPTPR